MAVQEQTPLREYTANGVTTSFALGFDCEETNHLIVTIDDVEVLPTDWYLSGSNVIFWNAPGNGKLIKLQRNTPFNRLADYQSYNNSFRPPAINKEFDRIWWKLQELGVADWILHNRIDALKAYVDRQDSELQQNIDNLKIYVDDKDDELRAYLLEEIRKQGVALDQLDEYYNYLMQRLAQIAIDKGWEASFVVSAGGDNQQEINDRGGSYWREKPLGYDINSRVMLENGDIVRSTVSGNTANPNLGMTGWAREKSNGSLFLYADEIGLTKWTEFKKPPYTAQEYEQAYNNGVRLTSAIKAAHDAGYGEVVLEQGQYPLVYTNESGGTFSQGIIGQLKFHYLTNLTVNYNGSIFFVMFDSNNKNPYDKNTSLQPYQLFGCISETRHVKNITFENGLFVGDEYTRSWVTGEDKTEQTHGMRHYVNSVGIRYKNMKFTGFRGDGISGNPKGEQLTTLNTWYKGGIDILGVDLVLAGAYRTGKIDLRGKTIHNNSVQLNSSGYLRAIHFRNDLLTAAFYRENGAQISQTNISQADNIELPTDTAFIQFVAYDDERTDETVSYGEPIVLYTGGVYDVYIDDGCEFYDIHRGGISSAGLTIFVGKAKFKNLGSYSMMGFPHYNDPTQYGINIEDSYGSKLILSGTDFSNMRQGVLANLRKVEADGCSFKNMDLSAFVNYGCAFATLTNSTFDNTIRAFEYVVRNPETQKQFRATNNTLRNTALTLDFSQATKLSATIANNIANNTRFFVTANKNVDVINNTITNVKGRTVETAVINGGRIVTGNTLGLTNTNYESRDWAVVGVLNSLSSNANTFIITKPDHRLPLVKIENELLEHSGFVFNSPGLTIRQDLTDKAKGWSNHIDKFKLKNGTFDNTRILFVGVDGQNRYNTDIVIDDCKFINSSRIEINKRESASYDASTTKLVIKNSKFDLTVLGMAVQIGYTLLGSCEITFINCEFVSDTEKTIKLVQAGSGATTSNITSKAIGCRFVNVTNTDEITVVS